ncbi:MAG: signal recognition particle protein, partial [Firmicutes bacterium]|nr:signal recognition particle protein [Bacillota bacterium]
DIYRPAAINQLKVVGKTAGVEVFEEGKENPVKIAKNAVKHAEKFGFDYVIIDTAGRLQIDEALMKELEEIQKAVKPSDILFTCDAMTGQEAVNVADTFNKRLEITGVIMTKLDGDTRGGATLSVKAVINKPIKFCAVGEKISDLEPFHPDRMASRILGMGDVLTLIEKAQDLVTEEQAKKLEKKFKEASFTLDDYLEQFDNLKKMGNLSDIMAMIPGASKKFSAEDLDEKKLAIFKAIIQSMTKKERENPNILNSSRKKRIAAGSGTSIQEINQLIKQFEQTQQMMKQFKNNKRGGMPSFFR